MPALEAFAPAKVNLTLRVLGRRADGYHELESLVVFADVGDRLTLTPGPHFALDVAGPEAAACGSTDANLVTRAWRALSERVDGLRSGRFVLHKVLPVAAGLGGGSSDAAAALRLLARVNGVDPADPRLHDAAVATGADVAVCLDPRAAMMRGAGERVERLAAAPSLSAVLVNPRVPLETRRVFAELGLAAGARLASESRAPHRVERAALAAATNDLEPTARRLAPVLDDVAAALTRSGAALARLSGSGATMFGLYDDEAAAAAAAASLTLARPAWWTVATRLGVGPR